MEPTWQEMLSALMDDELSEEEMEQAFALICKNEEAMATWKRWHMAKALLSDMPQHPGSTLQVQQQLLQKLSQRRVVVDADVQSSEIPQTNTDKVE
jgi:negative regulator of sigma E activity